MVDSGGDYAIPGGSTLALFCWMSLSFLHSLVEIQSEMYLRGRDRLSSVF